jgi:surface protein
MFRGASNFDSDLGDWDVSNVFAMNGMFDGARSFTGRRLHRWNVQRCKKMFQTFDGVRFDVWDRTKKWRVHPKCKSENNVSYRTP